MASCLFAGLALLLAVALHDVAFRTVPNAWVAALAVCGLVLRIASGEVVPGMIAAVLVFALAVLCWWRGWMGGGDAKLLGAGALLVAPLQVPLMLVCVSIAGGALALPYLSLSFLLPRRRVAGRMSPRPHRLVTRILRAERWRLGRGGPLPYAVAIGAGVGATVLLGAP